MAAEPAGPAADTMTMFVLRPVPGRWQSAPLRYRYLTSALVVLDVIARSNEGGVRDRVMDPGTSRRLGNGADSRSVHAP
jgi:hypothetical protein